MKKNLRVDRVIGTIFFILAGATLTLLTPLDAFLVFTAGGVDVPAPADQAHMVMLVFSLSWLFSFTVTIIGLVIWIKKLSQGKRILLFALGDFVLVVGLFLLAIAIAITLAPAPGQ